MTLTLPAVPADPATRSLVYDDPAEVSAALGAWKNRDAAREAQSSADAATIAGLRAQLATLTRIRWGSNVPRGTMPSKQAAFSPTVIRFFHGAGDAHIAWPTEAELGGPLPAGCSVIYSSQIPISEIASGARNAELQAWAAAAPFDRKSYFCVRHEPEKQLAAGQFTKAQIDAAWQQTSTIMRQSGKPIAVTPILMGWSVNPASGRNVLDYLPDPAVFDVIGFDTYKTNPGVDPTTMYDLGRRYAESIGKAWIIPETGVDHGSHTAQQCVDALNAMSTALSTGSTKPEAVSYFDSNPPPDWTISTRPAELASWKAGQSA